MVLEKLRQRRDQIRDFPYLDRTPIADIAIYETDAHHAIAVARQQKGYKPFALGMSWGRPWSTAWMRMRFVLPKSFAGLPAVARIDTGGEACAFLGDAPLQGLDRHHNEILLSPACKGGERFELWIEAGAQGAFGNFDQPRLSLAEIAAVDSEMRAFYWDFDALWELLPPLPEHSRRRALLLRGLNRAIDCLLQDGFEPALARRHAKAARSLLQPLLDQPADASALTLSLIGHAHIDVAWLWPLRETIRKCSRTFSTVVTYMDEYPHYKFAQSQAHLYWYTKTHYPALYEKIKHYARKQRWEVVAGMWVEPDMNLSGAEALVRQILLAKRYTRQEFDYETDVLWLPDVFGYCAALPQVLKKAGIHYFSTIKLFWSEVNKPPYQSFWWQGIDGTRILAHFPPNGDYNAVINGERLHAAARAYNEKDRADVALFPFGWGDGGGGPALSHMERSKRYANLEGIPKTRMQFISDFFEALEQGAEDLPVWSGELYLETHRGTYTSQAANKRNNRKSELLYRDAEFLAALAAAFGAEYPREALNDGWRLILLNQFHDILPGSSIHEVYEDSAADYARVHTIGATARDGALAALTEQVDTRGEGTPVIVVNSLPWERETTVALQLPASRRGPVSGPQGPTTAVSSGGELRFRAVLPPMGYAVYHIAPGRKIPKPPRRVRVDKDTLESDLYRLRFDKNGLLRSIYDKRYKREVLAAGGRGNLFERFQDRSICFDAWNIDQDVFATAKPITHLESVAVLELDPLRAGVRQTRRFGASTITQDIVLEAENPLILFDTTVDWRESWQLLKVGFAVDVRAAEARYEIQFGHVRRPTHENTSWDRARFETCAHKWVDLSEPTHGVALLNESKYGHDIHDNVIRLTLLKSAKEPDPTADMGEQKFQYALLPHDGDFRQGDVIRRAYEFNVPPTTALVEPHPGALPPAHGFLRVDAPNAMIEAVKMEEDGARWIVRVYECYGERADVTLTCGLALGAVSECDLLERNHKPLEQRGNAFSFSLAPFEIRTFALAVHA